MIKFGIGQAVRCVEDQRFLTGQGRYVDDIALPGMCHGVNVLSPHAHARVKKVDASKTRAEPGVLLVLTGAEVVHDHLGAFTAAMMPEDLGAPQGHRIHRQLLQSDKARLVGDRIAFIVAETLAQARDAADMVEVDYEPLPAVALLEDAAKDGAPKVWDDNPNGNVAFQLMIGQKATDAAFAKAKHHVKLRIENNRVTPVSMSRATPRSAIDGLACSCALRIASSTRARGSTVIAAFWRLRPPARSRVAANRCICWRRRERRRRRPLRSRQARRLRSSLGWCRRPRT